MNDDDKKFIAHERKLASQFSCNNKTLKTLQDNDRVDADKYKKNCDENRHLRIFIIMSDHFRVLDDLIKS